MSHPSNPTGGRRQPAPACRIGLAVLLGSAFLPSGVAAHEGETPVHYVAESGEDVGSCDHPSTPCRTIEYALTKADKGDEVLVAGGSYQFYPEDPAEVVMLLSPIITVRGGYSAEDDFARQTPGDNPTVLIGPDQSRAPDLRSRGFVVQAQAETQAEPETQDRGTLAALGTPRYVVPDGLQQGDCTDPAQACELAYALTQLRPGDSLLMASGSYVVPPEATDDLLRPDITLRGGYVEEESFARAAPAVEPSYVTGPPHELRDELAARGLTLIQDRKGLAIEESLRAPEPARAPPAVLAATPCDAATGMAGPHPCRGVDLMAHVPLADFSSQPAAANDIWGFVDLADEREYALIGLLNGTAVVEVTDPENPREVGIIRGRDAKWRDIKVYQFDDPASGRRRAYAYVTADFPSAPQGLQIIDLSALPGSVSLAATWNGIARAHNVYLANVDYATGVPLPGFEPILYITGSNQNGGAVLGLDISNPEAPVPVLSPPAGTQYIHDGTSLVLTDARTAACRSGASPPAGGHDPCELFVDFNEDTLDLWDVTDRAQPLRLSVTPYPGASYTHSGWWSQDKRFIFVQDELDEQDGGLNTTLRTFDISDLTAPVLSGMWSGPTRAIDHNGFTVGDRYYMSNYRRGLTILDVSDPNAPVEDGFFDTFPSPATDSAAFNGAWGVYPFLPSRTLVVSDIENGLFVLREAAPPTEEPGRVVAWEYPVKLVCGTQEDPEDQRLSRGGYATMINIANVGDQEATFTKRLALTLPPGRQTPGETARIGEDRLQPDQALKTDCADIGDRVFQGGLPAAFIEGFVVIRSDRPLEVSAVYASSALEAAERIGGGTDVETIAARLIRQR
jgi:choice-of-anchor B domain-containing protein